MTGKLIPFRAIKQLSLAFVVLSCCTSCEKKLFKKVHISGRVIDWFTNQPSISNVGVYGYDYKNEKFIKLKENFQTDLNGNFNIDAKAVRSSEYYISFKSLGENSINNFVENLGQIEHLNIEDGETKNFGDLLITSHTFYCKITLQHTSNQDCGIYIDNTPNDLFFPSGTSTVLTSVHYYTKERYEADNHNLVFTYLLLGPGIDEGHTVTLPITNSDTLYTTINY